ncbi:hypothetical protein SAMN05421820_1159 [Pedobacter steynii]|uniref:Uncharacterized protein n=1 Tax=Pedobacter steynii TaxID=430522 RepID=A0A1H0JKZ9_9SPHI|nr:hypothetical protein SAMN05421820_1159 [Pedobacter steynii]
MIQKTCLLLLLFIGIKNVVTQDRRSNLDLFFSSLLQTGQFVIGVFTRLSPST